jgi:hypothetical protein
MYQLVDGAWVEEDAAGTTTIVAGPDGTPPIAADTSIVSSFIKDTFGQIGAAIRSGFAMPPAAVAAPATPSAAMASSLITPEVKQMLTVAAIGFIVKKLFFP